MMRLQSIAAADAPTGALRWAIATLEAERAADGAWLLPGGAVLLLEATRAGHWRIRYWEPQL